MWEILSNHTIRNLLTQATIKSSHATIGKRRLFFGEEMQN